MGACVSGCEAGFQRVHLSQFGVGEVSDKVHPCQHHRSGTLGVRDKAIEFGVMMLIYCVMIFIFSLHVCNDWVNANMYTQKRSESVPNAHLRPIGSAAPHGQRLLPQVRQCHRQHHRLLAQEKAAQKNDRICLHATYDRATVPTSLLPHPR